jgi:hypothetical protein
MADEAIDLRLALSESIRQRPVPALVLAAGAGFILGGGLRSRLGTALMLLAGKTIAREVMLSAVLGAINPNAGSDLETPGTARGGRKRSSAESERSESTGRIR